MFHGILFDSWFCRNAGWGLNNKYLRKDNIFLYLWQALDQVVYINYLLYKWRDEGFQKFNILFKVIMLLNGTAGSKIQFSINVSLHNIKIFKHVYLLTKSRIFIGKDCALFFSLSVSIMSCKKGVLVEFESI